MPPIHADKMERAIGAKRGKVLQNLAQKRSELGSVHLARSHREGAMVDCPEAACVTVDRHVVGRVAEYRGRTLLAHQSCEVGRVERVTAEHSVRAEQP